MIFTPFVVKTGVDKLRDLARAWAARVKKIVDTPVPRELQDDKQALVDRALKIKTNVEKILGTVDEFSGIMGAWPMIAAGAVTVAGAAAAIAMWDSDAEELLKTLSKLQAQGYTPGEAAALYKAAVSKPGIIDKTKSLVGMAAVGVAAYLLLR